MRKTFLLLFFLISFFYSNAQESSDVPTDQEALFVKHEIGVNVTRFFNSLISFNELQLLDLNGQSLFYKYYFKKNHALRVGASVLHQKRDSGPNNGISISSLSAYSLVFGYVYNRPITKRWLVFTSLDVLCQYNQSKFVFGLTSDNTQSTKDVLVGGGPVLGIQLLIAPKVSIGTEMSLYFKHLSTELTSENLGAPPLMSESTSNTFSMNTPASLYLNFRF